jgi:F0F1-type ATP synthase assembly protein I
MIVETMILAVLAAIMYAGTEFIKKYMDPTNPENFDYVKFIATIVIGAVIGVASGYQGTIPTELSITEQLALYAGATVVLENVLKIIYRWITNVNANTTQE